MSESPLLNEYPVIHANGREYPMRPLGIRDVQAFVKLLKGVTTKGNAEAIELLKGQRPNQADVIGAVLIAGISAMFDDAVKFLAGLLEVPVKEFEDPRRFPLGAHAQVIQGLLEHPDLIAFLSQARTLANSQGLERLTAMFSPAPSTSSSPATAGATSKS